MEAKAGTGLVWTSEPWSVQRGTNGVTTLLPMVSLGFLKFPSGGDSGVYLGRLNQNTERKCPQSLVWKVRPVPARPCARTDRNDSSHGTVRRGIEI